MMKQVFTQDNRRVSYQVVGNGKPLLLIHGFGEDSRIWELMLPTLEKHAKVICVDLPGVGESDVPVGEPSLDVYADAIALVLKQENISSAHVVGHSMGGYTAMALVERYNDLVESLCLFHSHPFADDDARKAKREKDIDFIKRLGGEEFIKVLIPNLFTEKFKSENGNIVNDLVARYKNLSPDGLIYALTAMRNRPDRSQLLKDFTKSFFIIAGVQDQIVKLEVVTQICGLAQLTEVLFIREAAHMGMIEFPQKCSDSILNSMNIKLS